MSAAVPLSDFDRDLFLTYPHANGFLGGEPALIAGRMEGGSLEFHRLRWDAEEPTVRVGAVPLAEDDAPSPFHVAYFDVATDGTFLIAIAGGQLWRLRLDQSGAEPESLYRAPAGEKLHPLPCLSADGRRALLPASRGERHAGIEIDLASGRAIDRVEAGWWINHLHYCPHDEAWIGYCHEGPCDQVPDRVWGQHPDDAPDGRALLGQYWNDPVRRLFVGHERWCFHDRSVLAVAYGASPGGPRGIYEAFADGRPTRLVGEGDRDWHVAPSHCGRWAAVDTTGPHDAPGKGWDNAGPWSDVLILDTKTGERRFLARTCHASHPSHPHPVFSLDGRWIFYNEASLEGCGNRIMRVSNPWSP